MLSGQLVDADENGQHRLHALLQCPEFVVAFTKVAPAQDTYALFTSDEWPAGVRGGESGGVLQFFQPHSADEFISFWGSALAARLRRRFFGEHLPVVSTDTPVPEVWNLCCNEEPYFLPYEHLSRQSGQRQVHIKQSAPAVSLFRLRSN